jgi:hypothetical protein
MRSIVIAALAALTVGGCASSKREVADGEHLTDFQKERLLGHYSTIDGKTGFVLDRTVDPPKARLDGDGTVHTLARQGSVQGAFELVSGDSAIWLRIHEESGEVMLFDGPQQTQGVDVIRDADADRL